MSDRLREMDIDDKVCEQVSMSDAERGVSAQAVIERCVQQSQPWSSKARRVRPSTALSSGAVCDRHGVVEPIEPMPGVGTSWWASSVMLHPGEP